MDISTLDLHWYTGNKLRSSETCHAKEQSNSTAAKYADTRSNTKQWYFLWQNWHSMGKLQDLNITHIKGK